MLQIYAFHLGTPRNSECLADSGGPLTYTKGNEIIIFGILHGHVGHPDTRCRLPEVFTRLSEKSTHEWITKEITNYP